MDLPQEQLVTTNTTPNIPTTPQPVPEMIGSEKKFPLIPVVLSILLLATLVFGTFFFLRAQNLQKQLTSLPSSSPSPTPTPIASVIPSSDPTADWQTYDSKLGFSFKTAKNIVLNQDMPKNSEQISVTIEEKDLSNYIDEPLGFNLKTALSDQTKLQNNEFGEKFGETNSQKVVTLGNGINAKIFTILRQIEVCDVQFTRRMIFFYKNHQIIVTVNGPADLSDQLATYFTTDKTNCGQSLIWKEDNHFIDDLNNNKASQKAVDWYVVMDQILSTFRFTDQ